MDVLQGWVTFQATTDEYRAIHRVIACYIYYIRRNNISPVKRSPIIETLLSFQMRLCYYVAADMVMFQGTIKEVVAFEIAVVGYYRLVDTDMPHSEQELQAKQLIRNFQHRYMNMLGA